MDTNHRRAWRAVAPQHRRLRRGARGGFTLIEIMIALTVLAIGLGSIAVASVRCAQMQSSTLDYIDAHNVCRNVIERLQNGSLITRFQEYKAAPTFTVGDQSVTVSFPAALAVTSLGVAIPATARFRDLDADGDLDLNAASVEVVGLLPVRIVVTRTGFRYQSETLLAGI